MELPNKNEIVQLVKLFLSDYIVDYNGTQGATKKIKTKYSLTLNALPTSSSISEDYDFTIKIGIGSGNLAKCPYIAIMHKGITSTPTYGIYVVIIFKDDMSGFYLMLNQGISFLSLEKSDYQKIRKYWCDQIDEIPKEENISLSIAPTRMIIGYEAAYILFKKYSNDFDADDFIKDLEDYLDYYLRISKIINAEYDNDLDKMYKQIIQDESQNHALAAVQLYDRNRNKTDTELLDEFINSILEDSAETKGIVFFLGAGVSSAIGAPDWNTLVFELLVRKWQLDITKISEKQIKEYVNGYASSTAMAAMVKNMYDNEQKDEFIAAIHDICYEKKIDDESILNSPLGHIAIMSMQRKTRVEAIITYNYDDYLEQAIGIINKNATEEYITIYEKSQSKIISNNKLPIYHVHGYIPKDSYINGSHIILTENEYHQLYSDFFNWTNIIQAKYLMDYTCIFLGMSFSDPNQRRILENVSQFIPKNRSNYLIISNKVPNDDNLASCDYELNKINSSWNATNFKLKTYYVNGKAYNDINHEIINIINRIKQ